MSASSDGLGQRIRIARNARGISQEKFARELNVALMTVSRWERNETTPSLERIYEIADRLDVPVAALITEAAA